MFACLSKHNVFKPGKLEEYMTRNIHQIVTCPDCGGSNLSYNDADNQVICKDCGLIYEPLEPAQEKKFEDTHKQ